MPDFVTAYNKETGKKHPFPVPRHWINHPTLRPPLSDKPVKEQDNSAPTTPSGGGPSSPQTVAETNSAGQAAKAKKEGPANGTDAR